MKQSLSLMALLVAVPALAEENRQLDAHEHGVGSLNIAVDGTTVAMEFHAPGADIVGFEYAAKSEADRLAVDAAVATLATPLDLFLLPSAAGCSVTQASAALENTGAGENHGGHEAGMDHDNHAGQHASHGGHEDHGAHDDHETHSYEAGHTEFHAEYRLSCAAPEALTGIDFAYFGIFPNAREVEVQIITGSGARAFEVTRDSPGLDLRSLF